VIHDAVYFPFISRDFKIVFSADWLCTVKLRTRYI
jgi:hypothetical protein